MAIHWNIEGTADNWSSKFFTVFASPLFIFITHWICVSVTIADPKNKNQTKKAIGLIFWICPFISLFASAIIYASAFGLDFNIDKIMMIVIGLMFVVTGNYLPKCKQNNTLGIKVKWTLENEEN